MFIYVGFKGFDLMKHLRFHFSKIYKSRGNEVDNKIAIFTFLKYKNKLNINVPKFMIS